MYRFPKILVLHLKRFKYSTWRKEKLNIAVELPLTKLDMSAYAGKSTHASVKKASYSLYGISNHSGYMGGGHYVADTLNATDGKWYRCDDSRVSKGSTPGVSSSAYVLFYVRDDVKKN